ncbi:hypothetical protein Tco_1304078 [Tanacetum coccineum]
MTLAASTSSDKSLKDFNKLMSTPIDFSRYILNGLKIKNSTQEFLLGPAFRLLKGTLSNYAKLEYDFEECYKALSKKLDWENLEGDDYPFDLSKPLPLITRIEDMVPNIWSSINVAYNRYALWGISHWREQLKSFYAYERGIQSRGDVYFTKRILAVTHVKIQGRLMRSDELYKFNDGTLTKLLSSLEDITKNINMEYLPKRRWSTLEKKIAYFIIKDINKLLKERRMMRSLEKFIGGRLYGTDLRLLQILFISQRYSNPMIQPEPEGSTQGYPLVSVEVLRPIFTDSMDTPTKYGRMKKPYSSPCFTANYFISGIFKDGDGERYEHVDPEVTSLRDGKVYKMAK